MSFKRITFSIGAAPPARLDKAIARDVPEEFALSRTRLARLLADGDVRVDGTVIKDPKTKPVPGSEIDVYVPAPDESHLEPEDIPLHIIYEDEHLVVVDKPAGMVVHPAPGTPNGTLVNALMHHCGAALSGVGGMKRPGIVHRIDKDTSGLLVVAKSDAAHHGLARQFAAHTVDRVYRALVFGAPDAGDPRLRGLRGVSFEAGNTLKITTHLGRHKTDRQRQAVFFENGRHAVTRAQVLATYGDPALVSEIACRLETGRTHQIRVHMAYTGHGLVGDPVYGGKRKLRHGALSAEATRAIETFPRQALHAELLGFLHPVTEKPKRFESPLPPDMKQLIKDLVT